MGKSEQGATSDVIPREPEGYPCGSSLALQSIPMALKCFSWLSSLGTWLREQQMLDT